MKYYVVSEVELNRLGELRGYDHDDREIEDLYEAEAACRARPVVPDDDINFPELNFWVEVEK